MTKEQIQILPTNGLRAIVASTSPTGSKWVELCWARNELVRRTDQRTAAAKADDDAKTWEIEYA